MPVTCTLVVAALPDPQWCRGGASGWRGWARSSAISSCRLLLLGHILTKDRLVMGNDTLRNLAMMCVSKKNGLKEDEE